MSMSGNFVFGAIADPTRREILALLEREPSGVEALAARFPVSRPAISRHLRVLHEAGLVTRTEMGRSNSYRTNAAPLAEVRAWLDEYWGGKLALLKRIAEGDS